MRIFLGLLTPDREINDVFGNSKDGVVPKDVLARGYLNSKSATVKSSAFAQSGDTGPAEVEKFVLANIVDADACIIIIDSRWHHLIRDIDSAVFSIVFDVEEVGASIKNFFQKIIARALKNFSVLAAKFDQGDEARILGLPLRNFHAQELINLATICKTERDASALHNNVEKQLVILRRRVRPRRKSSYKNVYAVDDSKRFFSFGIERHSLFATGGDHLLSCEVNGTLRFGYALDKGRHYNVSETEKDETTISGLFIDCHNTRCDVKTTTHLNMFSNDYF